MRRLFSFLFFILFCINGSFAQTKNLKLTLPELVTLAQAESPSVQIAETRLTNNYWRYQSFLADYKPQIDLSANLPQLERTIQPYLLPNGRDVFLNRSSITSGANLFLRQDIAKTGGSIFATTGLQHKYNFPTDINKGITSYFSTPILIGFSQPLFGFNHLKWNKKIRPLLYSEAKREYSFEMEQVALQSAQFFFQVLVAQFNKVSSELEKINADTLYTISKGRFSVGRIAETELLQVELQVMNADARLATATLNLQSSMEQLRNFLGIKESVTFELVPPTDIPEFMVDVNTALDYARANRSESISFERQLIQADRDVAEAKANNSLQINVNGSFGLSQTGATLGDAFSQTVDQERLSVGINIPIADWGKSESRLKIEESNRDLQKRIVAQDRVNFEREIILKVQQFALIRNQVKLALRAYDVSKKREEMTRKRYLIGKISITNLNLAIREQEETRVRYVSALQAYWIAYYELRLLTLYDFENGVPLVKTLEGY